MPATTRPPARPPAWHRATTGSREAPALIITTRTDAGVALLRGKAARDTITALGIDAKWSPLGRGHVIPTSRVQDIAAWAQLERLLCVIHEDKTPTATKEPS